MPAPRFTVFTPTFNRAATLHRVYESLQAQTFRDFEWLIVDDGSTDNTEDLVKSWQAEADFPVRYIRQEHGHKKTAHNTAVREARGTFFLVFDSDDRCVPEALERFDAHGREIEDAPDFSGVCALCAYEDGSRVGDAFPGGGQIDAPSAEIRWHHRIKGEKWGIVKTDVVRQFPYPENVPGHVPEGVVWSRIGACYKIRFINEILRIYCQDTGSAAPRISTPGNPAAAAPGNILWKHQILSDEIRWFRHAPLHFLLDAARLTRFWLHSPPQYRQEYWPASKGGRILTALMVPAGALWYLMDLLRKRIS